MTLSLLLNKWLKELTNGHFAVDDVSNYIKCKCYSGWAVIVNDLEAVCIIPIFPHAPDREWPRIKASDPNLFKLIEERLISIHSSDLINPVSEELRKAVEHGRN